MTHVQAFKTPYEMNTLRMRLGIFLHAPLHFLIVGGLFALMGLTLELYYQVGHVALGIMVVTGGTLLGVAGIVFTYFVQASWEAFSPNGPLKYEKQGLELKVSTLKCK